MKKSSMKYSTKWIYNIIIYSMVIGIPLIGYILQSDVLQNFGVAIMFLWGGMTAIGTTAIAVGLIIAYSLNDRPDKQDLYDALTERHLLFYVARLLALVTAITYIWIGYPLFGAYLLLLCGMNAWIYSLAIVHYDKFKLSLVKG